MMKGKLFFGADRCRSLDNSYTLWRAFLQWVSGNPIEKKSVGQTRLFRYQ